MTVASDVTAYVAQARAAADWLDALPDGAFAAASVLPGWDVRTLIGHLVGSKDGLAHYLGERGIGGATPAAAYVQAYRPAAEQITVASVEITGEQTPEELTARLRTPVEFPDGVTDGTVLAGPRGPITATDFVRTRLLDLVVHCDDLSRSLPDRDPLPLLRPGLGATVRLLAGILAAQAPGRSVEVRVPPFVAVQVVDGPRHTRGTPPNVVETDPVTWLRIATGRIAFAAAVADGSVRASGNRADLTDHLPVLS